MFSQTAEYALRAAVWLATQHDQPKTTRQIARATRVPAGYLSKVLRSLVRAGLVTSQRGLGGGFILAAAPRKITVYEVISAVDAFQRIRECPLGLKSHSVRLCPLHRKLDDAALSIEKAFRDTRLDDLLIQSGPIRPLVDE